MRTSDNPNLHRPIDHKGQGDDVLASAEQSFGAIDGIERPETMAARAASPIDPSQHLLGPGRRVRQHLPDELDHASTDCTGGCCAQRARVLLCDERIAREITRDSKRQERLHDEVRRGDRRCVSLCERVSDRVALRGPHETNGVADRLTGEQSIAPKRLQVHYRINGLRRTRVAPAPLRRRYCARQCRHDHQLRIHTGRVRH